MVKKHVLRILICLMLGAVCTVAVSWGSSATVRWWDLATDDVQHSVVVDPDNVEPRYVREYGYVGGRFVWGQRVVHQEHGLATICIISNPGSWDRSESRQTMGGAMLRRVFSFTPPLIAPVASDDLDGLSPPWLIPLVDPLLDRASISGDRQAPSRNSYADPMARIVGWGWPKRAMWSQHDIEWWQAQRAAVIEPAIVLPLSDTESPAERKRLGHARVLPLGIIWSGFVINTLCYVPFIWVVLFLPGTIRRVIRRRRGRCAACGYILHADSGGVCRECGAAAVSDRAGETQTT